MLNEVYLKNIISLNKIIENLNSKVRSLEREISSLKSKLGNYIVKKKKAVKIFILIRVQIDVL